MDNSRCLRCEEPILPGEWFVPINYVGEKGAEVRSQHKECSVRAVIGSAAHQLKRCTCHGYQFEDPPYMTKREAAKMALFIFELFQDQSELATSASTEA